MKLVRMGARLTPKQVGSSHRSAGAFAETLDAAKSRMNNSFFISVGFGKKGSEAKIVKNRKIPSFCNETSSSLPSSETVSGDHLGFPCMDWLLSPLAGPGGRSGK